MNPDRVEELRVMVAWAMELAAQEILENPAYWEQLKKDGEISEEEIRYLSGMFRVTSTVDIVEARNAAETPDHD